MQTIDLGATFSSSELEGVVLGVVYTAAQTAINRQTRNTGRVRKDPRARLSEEESRELEKIARDGDGGRWKTALAYVGALKEGRKEEIRSERKTETETEMWGCLEDAVRKVGERRQMEGVLELERGTVSFLVYRID